MEPQPQVAGDQRIEEWREFHRGHLDRQTRAIETTRNYVAAFFWLTMLGAVFLVLMGAAYS